MFFKVPPVDFAPVRMLGTHLTKQIAPRPFGEDWGGGCWSVGRERVDRLTQLSYDVTSVLDLCLQSIRILEPEVIGPVYRVISNIEIQYIASTESAMGAHWLNPQIANKSCRKRKMQSFLLVIFQSFNFSCNTLLNNWLKNWADFV
jgi:hypothetical protein